MNEQDLVLVGGGHSHALIVRRLAMKPIPQTRLTLISEKALTAYSGMLPGWVAGHYSREQAHIDLNQLCRWAGVRWIEDKVIGLDLEEQQLLFAQRPPVNFDTVSLDIGSSSKLPEGDLPDHVIGVKPVSGFHSQWQQLLAQTADARPAHWGVIGAGAAGVELVLAMAHRLQGQATACLHLVFRGERILKGYPARAVSAAEAALKSYGVQCHAGFDVAATDSAGIAAVSGQRLDLDQSVWCAGATAPAWLSESGLLTDSDGFVSVDAQLQSVSHPGVFACGDIAHLRDDPRPKAGVYAVRQAPLLEANLRRLSLGQALKPIKLQSQYLSLLSLGGKQATGSRHGIAFSGHAVWRVKDHIDRAFMRKFQQLGTPRPMPPPELDKPHCGGCGGKLGPDLLTEGLAGLPIYRRDEIKPALSKAEDASTLIPPAGKALVQSIDGFRAFCDDLYLVGRAATEHSLNDVYAMGGEPLAAHVWVSTTIAHPRLQARDHRALMQGIAESLALNHATLAGGHSSESMDCSVGIAVTGAVAHQGQWGKTGLQLGDALVLNKGLGTGVIFAADMQAQAPATAVQAALHSMCSSNRSASHALAQHKPHAVTDVSGFGLLGHLLEMLGDAGDYSAVLQAPAVPLLSGSLALSASGWRSSLYPAMASRLSFCAGGDQCPIGWLDLLLDPQTSGGLLAALPAERAQSLCEQLDDYMVIGRVTARQQAHVLIKNT